MPTCVRWGRRGSLGYQVWAFPKSGVAPDPRLFPSYLCMRPPLTALPTNNFRQILSNGCICVPVCMAVEGDALRLTRAIPAPVAKLLVIIVWKSKQKVLLSLIMSLLFLQMLLELSGT